MDQEEIKTKEIPFILYFMCKNDDSDANQFLKSIDAKTEYMNVTFNNNIINTYSYKLYDSSSLNDDDVDYHTVMEQASNKMSSILKGSSQYNVETITAKQIGQIKTLLHDKQDETTTSKLSPIENQIRVSLKEFAIEYGIDEPQQLQFLFSMRKSIIKGDSVDYNYMQEHKLEPLSFFDSSIVELLIDRAEKLSLSVNNTAELEKTNRPTP